MNGSLSLRGYPEGIVRLTCEKWGRRGQYWKDSLIVRFCPDIALPVLRAQIGQCERQKSIQDPCGVHFEGLT